jgi:hypothetical protein
MGVLLIFRAPRQGLTNYLEARVLSGSTLLMADLSRVKHTMVPAIPKSVDHQIFNRQAANDLRVDCIRSHPRFVHSKLGRPTYATTINA